MTTGDQLVTGFRRRGSTLAAVVVTVMIIAALAAVALPVVQGAQTLDDANRTAVMLKSLDSSLESNSGTTLIKGICRTTSRCPKFLSSLVYVITNTTPTCRAGANFSNADVTNWLTAGPFSGYPIIAGKGLKTPLGWIHDTLTTLATNSIEMHIDSLTLDQANYLDIAVDVAAGAAAGKLTYAEQAAIFTATGQHRYLAKYTPTANSNIRC